MMVGGRADPPRRKKPACLTPRLTVRIEFFFFSSRRRHTRLQGDWSSDVCSSDLNHIDNAIFTIPGTAIKVRSDVSTTVFFSEPDEYEGGELIVEDTFGHQSVKLAAGDAIVYPGTSLHRVNPVTRGTRYASFFWTHSLVASDEKRRILFDLDQQIQQLTVRHPGDPALSALSGTYHNLLRMWSQA